MATALTKFPAVLLLVPVVALAQPAFQPPPERFQMPSGNVHCRWGEGALRCQVLESAAAPEAARRCEGGWQGLLALRPEGAAEVLCRGPALRDEEAFVLGYGARWETGGITCESEESGLRCRNGAGQGFRAARGGVELF